MVIKQKRASAMRSERFAEHSVVLIMVLAVLVILALLGVTFATLTGMERTASRSYVDMTQAKMHARSGIERAIAELKSVLAEADFGSGEWYYGDGENCPVELARNPSFAVRDTAGNPMTIDIDGKPHGYSGSLKGTHPDKNDQYVLKVIDLSSKIYINGGKPAASATSGYNKVLAQILNNLGKILKLGNIGNKIIKKRPPRGYAHEDEVEAIIGKAAFEKLKEYITTCSWVNKKVLRPVPLAKRPKRPDWPKAKINRPIYVMEQINPGKLEFEPRAPVNVNTASREVIQALLTNLKGFYINQSRAGKRKLNLGAGASRITNLGYLKSAKISSNQAKQIAQKIITRRQNTGPFKTWAEFFKFCDKLGLTSEQIAVIKSNANPNTNLNDFNPTALIYRDVDKTDLEVYSTEFCLGPTGYFDIESIGRILGPDNSRLAEKKIACRVKLLDFWHETTQRDFKNGKIYPGKSLQTYPESKLSPGYPADYDGYILLSTLEAPYKYVGQDNIRLRASFNKRVKSGANWVVKAEVAKGQAQGLTERDGPFVNKLITTGEVGSLYPDGVYSEAYKCLRFPTIDNIHPYRGSIMFWYKPNWDPQLSQDKLRTLISMSRHKQKNLSSYRDYNTQMFFFLYVPKVYYYMNLSKFVPPAWVSFIPSKWLTLYVDCKQTYSFFCEGRWTIFGIFGPHMPPYSYCGSTPNNKFRAKPHKWQLVSLQWNFQGGDGSYYDHIQIYINGRKPYKLKWDRGTYHGSKKHIKRSDRHYNDLSGGGSKSNRKNPNPGIRLGELVKFPPGMIWKSAYGKYEADPWSRGDVSADSTIDELCVFDTFKSPEFNLSHYYRGRYYNGNNAKFTSAYKGFPKGTRLGRISSTIFLPPNVYPYECKGAKIEFKIVDSKGKALTPPLENGDKIVDLAYKPLIVSGRVAYRIYFKEKAGLNTPILESPVVDDVTITYFPPAHRILQWVQN